MPLFTFRKTDRQMYNEVQSFYSQKKYEEAVRLLNQNKKGGMSRSTFMPLEDLLNEFYRERRTALTSMMEDTAITPEAKRKIINDFLELFPKNAVATSFLESLDASSAIPTRSLA